MEDMGKEELYYEINRMRFKAGKENYKRPAFINNEIADDEYYEYIQKAQSVL